MKETWIRTFTGGKVYYFEPHKSNIEIEDVAHALSLICRFNGAVTSFYSVAQHSVFVCDMIYNDTKDKSLAYTGLMHDASEAFISDVPSPFKSHFAGYKKAEKRMEKWLAARFDFDFPYNDIIKRYDLRALSTEMRDLMIVADNENLPEPFDIKINPKGPKQAERMFMARYNKFKPKV
jgi:hypothetical protein